MTDKTLPKISSFAAPTEADLKAFDALTEDDKRALLADELAQRSKSPARRMLADEVLIGLRPPRHG